MYNFILDFNNYFLHYRTYVVNIKNLKIVVDDYYKNKFINYINNTEIFNMLLEIPNKSNSVKTSWEYFHNIHNYKYQIMQDGQTCNYNIFLTYDVEKIQILDFNPNEHPEELEKFKLEII